MNCVNKLWRITLDTNPEDCNLHCIMCEEHSPYSTFKQKLFETTGVKSRRMDFELVEKIIKEAAQLGVKEIIPSTMGEPLLYTEIEKIFELSEKYNYKVNLTTNGTFPRKPVNEWAKIIVPNTTDIKISWNGATEKTASSIMTGINFEKSVDNVKLLIAFRDKHYSLTGHYCRITFQLTFMHNNMHELSEIVKLAAELEVDRIKGHHLWTHFEQIEDLSMKKDEDRITLWNQYVKQVFLAREKYLLKNGKQIILENIVPLIHADEEVPEEYACPFLEKELWISATGVISPCCAPDNLRKSLGDFGKIQQYSISQVLTSDNYRNLVRNYKKQKLCKTCNMRKPVQS